MEFINNLSQIKNNWQPYEEWQKGQDEKDAKIKKLHKSDKLSKDQFELSKSYGRTMIDSINVIDEKSESVSQNVEAATEMMAGIALMPVVMAAQMGGMATKNKHVSLWAPTAVSVLAAIPLILWGTTKQVQSSKIARFHAREEDLKDPRNFVVYTPEQIEQAKKIAAEMPDEKEKKEKEGNLGEGFKTLKNLKADEAKRQEALKDQDIDLAKLTPEELEKYKNDQDILLRTIKKIDMTAEDYSEDAENVIQTVTSSSTVAGLISGGVVGGAGLLIKKFMKNIANPAALNKGIGFASMGTFLAFPLVAGVMALPIQKEASRIGRFKAKQELMNDPESFVPYNEKELNSVQINPENDIQKRPGFFGNIADSFKALGHMRKDAKEYKDYKKNQLKEEKKLRKAFEQIELKPGQLEEAKKLQQQLLHSFEKMDDKSQKYSENAEAATQIAQQLVGFLPILGGIAVAGAAKLVSKLLLPKDEHKALSNLIKAMKELNDPKQMEELTRSMNTVDFLGPNSNLAKALNDPAFLKLQKRIEKLKDSKLIKKLRESKRVQKYVENMTKELLELFTGKSSGATGGVFKKYKTLITTGLAVGIPAFLVVVGGSLAIGLAIQSFFTSLQKKASKIGVMEAMNELEAEVKAVQPSQPEQKQQSEQKQQPDSVSNSTPFDKFKR